MATYTANHLYVMTHVACTSGAFNGEEAVWGLRFCNGRTALNAGEFGLNTFDVHTDTKSRSYTAGGITGSITQPWSGDDAPETEQVKDSDIDSLFGAVATFWGAIKGLIPSIWKLDFMKLYAVNELGRAPSGPVQWTPTTPNPGTATGAQLGTEAAMCVSLYTADRTKHGRGRIYIGPVNAALTNDGLFPGAAITMAVNGMKALQDSVRTIGTTGLSTTYNGIVWNRSDKTRACTVNLVRVGDEPDTQERRTKSRAETFTNASVA